jgi:putative transposase
MVYRTIELAWHPRTTHAWTTFTASRKEAARLCGDLVVRHHRIRRLGWGWPSKARWQRWAKGRYPGLSAQSTQQLIGEFCEAVDSCRQLRKNGQAAARYPWRRPRYHDVMYTNQEVRIRDGRLVLPHGASGTLRIRLPATITLPGRLLEVRLSFGVVRLVCEIADAPRPQQTVIGVDLGVNTLIAAIDGVKVFLVSGRGVQAGLQWRNKPLAAIQQAQSSKTEGSLRWKRLQRRKHRLLDTARRQVRGATHKATHAIAGAFPGATCYVGEPFNVAAQRTGRLHAQPVSTACTRTIIRQLDYKTAGAITVPELYSSQTCPVCGERSTHRKTSRCPHCGATGPGDAVGAVNILSLGQHSVMLPGRSLPQQVMSLRPWRSSSGGHPARRSA